VSNVGKRTLTLRASKLRVVLPKRKGQRSMSKEEELRRGLAAVSKAMAKHEFLHNNAALGRALGVSKQAVANWWKISSVPTRHVLALERIYGVPRHIIRPDIYPAPWRDKSRVA
jgi:DNA-binding transcriptional regulator YdaS (Cro superfamily)